MKIAFYQKVQKEEKRIKKYFEVLLLVFTLASIAVILALSDLDKKIEKEASNTEDYVSVFKESELHEILFESTEK